MHGSVFGMPYCAMLALRLGTALLFLLAARCSWSAAPDGETVYRQACAACHESGDNRAPPLAALRQLSPRAVLDSLATGSMAAVGEALAEGHAEAVAAFLGRGRPVSSETARKQCDDSPWSDPFAGPRWNGWGADVANTRFQPGPSAGLDADSVPKLRLRWAFGLRDSDSVRGQPAVAGGRVFLGARNGRVYALEAKSGCTVWEFSARSEVRTAVTLAPVGADGRAALIFGDTKAHLYALDAETGRQLWRTKLDEHRAATLTGSPTVYEGRVYVAMSSYEEFTAMFPKYSCCTFRGSVSAVDAVSGERIWKTYMIPEEPEPRGRNENGNELHGPSGAAIWSAPTIDAELGRVYVATGDNYSNPPTDDSDAIVALDLETGSRLWSRQFTEGDAYNMACNAGADPANCPENSGPDLDFGSSPILVKLDGGQRLLVAGQKSGDVHAVDPDRDGAIVWQRRAGVGGMLGGIQFGPAADGRNAYVAVSDIAFGPRTLPDGRVVRGPKHDAGGGLTAFRLADGERMWHAPGIPCPERLEGCSPAQSAAVTAIPGVVFSGALDGFVRAYSAADGSVLWSYDTVREYPATVNGVPARGGSLNGPGPVAVDGALYVNSGYGQFGSLPGNAFLAFGIGEE